MTLNSTVPCLCDQGSSSDPQVGEEAFPPCLAQSTAAFSFPVFDRTCTATEITILHCLWWVCYLSGLLDVWGSEAGYVPTGSTTWCMAVFHAVICRHHVQLGGRLWGRTKAMTSCWLEVWVPLLQENVGKGYMKCFTCNAQDFAGRPKIILISIGQQKAGEKAGVSCRWVISCSWLPLLQIGFVCYPLICTSVTLHSLIF